MAIPAAIETIIEAGNTLFSERLPLLSHWQELAEHFYYERADFTGSLSIGADYAEGSFTSRAAIYRQNLGNLYRTMLRPDKFFEIKSADEDLNNHPDARSWMEYATELQNTTMYAREALLTRATDIADQDHVTFGQCVLEVAPRKTRDGVYYRCWHLRDVAWSEDYTGAVADIHRNDKSTLVNLVKLFGDKVPEALRKDADKTPHRKIKVRHVAVPADAYDLGFAVRPNHQWASIWVMPEEGIVLEKVSRPYRGYVVPRAATVSGSQYARSPFTSIILPDARTTQAIERILLEAGEKAIDPPMIAKSEVVRTDIGLYAGGITYLDAQYDERLGEALRPLGIDTSAIPFGNEMAARFDMVIREGLKTNSVSLPETSGLTAYQVRKVVEQTMRQQIPMFEPVEVEYNEPLCAETFAVMRSLGAFPANEIPEALRGANIAFSFKSPIKDLEDDGLRQRLVEGMEVIRIGSELDPAVAKLANGMEITKDMLRRAGWPEDWINDDERVAAAVDAMREEQVAAKSAGNVMGVAEAAGKAAPMVQALAGAA